MSVLQSDLSGNQDKLKNVQLIDEQEKLIVQFVHDLQLPELNLLAGEVNNVDTVLTPENVIAYLTARRHQNLYFLGGIDPTVGLRRAADTHVRLKNYFYLDFDIRTEWRKEYKEELFDAMVKEIGEGIVQSLSNHEFLRAWRYWFFSGNGVHVYYFGAPVKVRSIENWKQGMQRLLEEAVQVVHMQPDNSAVNVGRLARLPGSINHKGARPIPTEIMGRQEAVADIAHIERIGEEMIKKRGTTLQATQTIAMEGIVQGARDKTLTSIAGSLRRRGLGEAVILDAISATNARECKPPLPQQDLARIAKSIAKYPTAAVDTASSKIKIPVVVTMSEVVLEKVDWLWLNHIPRGKLSIIEGDPGAGKSWCTQAIASAITKGAPLPGEGTVPAHSPANVLLLIAEDGLGDTIRPRLEALEADLKRVKVLTGVRDETGEEQHFSLERDLAALDVALADGGYALVIVDPVNAYLGSVDTNTDAKIRSVLTPLTKLAERHNVAIICIRHLTKGGRDKTIYRGLGSIGYTAAARTVHLVGLHPEDKSKRVIICTKNNLVSLPPSFMFEISDRLKWGGETAITAEDLLAPDSSEKKSAVSEAKDFLVGILSEEPRRAADIFDEAKDAGLSDRTLKRAKKDLGILKEKIGGKNGFWTWKLPSSLKKTKKSNVDTLAPFKIDNAPGDTGNL